MRFIFKRLAPALLVLGLLNGSAFAQGRIATIDLRKAFDGYWKKREAEATLKDQKADIEKDLKGMLDELKKGRETYQKFLNDANDQAVSSEEREKRKKLAEDKLKEVKKMEEDAVAYDRQANQTLEERKTRVRANILSEIRNVVSAKAKAAGYALVIDTAAETANATPVILYNTTDNDITADVLSQLNAGAPTETTKADDKKDEKPPEKKKK